MISVREQLSEFLPNVYRFARQLTQDTHLAEDLTQEAMVRAMRCWRNGLPDRPLSWLFRVVENLWRDRCRKLGRQVAHHPLEEAVHGSAKSVLPEEQAQHKEELESALMAMGRLPERQRMVLHLHACEQFSVEEVSQTLEITPEAVRSSLSLARKALREWQMRRSISRGGGT